MRVYENETVSSSSLNSIYDTGLEWVDFQQCCDFKDKRQTARIHSVHLQYYVEQS